VIAPVVLSVFFTSAVIGSCWGEEGKITAKVEMPSSVKIGGTFTVKVTMYKEDSSGKQNPIIGQGSVSIESNSDFIIKGIEPADASSNGEWRIKMKASMNDGKFKVTVMSSGSTINSDSTVNSTQVVKVMIKSSMFTYIGLLGGAYLGGEGALSLATFPSPGNSSNDYGKMTLWQLPFVNVFVFFTGIAFGGGIGGILGNWADEAIDQNDVLTSMFYPVNYPLFLAGRLFARD
jgi:hypothetical protein